MKLRQKGVCVKFEHFCSVMTGFRRGIYVMIALTLEFWVLRGEYKLLNFIMHDNLDTFLANSNLKNFSGEVCTRTPLNGLIKILPSALSFGCCSTLCWRAPGFPEIPPPAISHHEHKHRLKFIQEPY